jgi:peptide/nickel transport system ATP-binding protein
VPNIRKKRKRIILKGEISSPINPKPGCRFAPRCNFAMEECFMIEPELKEHNSEHFVACHLCK